ncbi:MAG: hypothetical protein CL843_12350 [Crocinitomicaceae bacterium]|nr:hypothetical protein [Crocinitomicaceae bacterium]|tara:strand:- start:7271 stop:7825 length:555 start_codon:yes stop_codon:yes gene_type:complete
MKKNVGKNTTVSKQEGELIIKITGTLPEKWMEHSILAWVILWSSLGGIILYYMIAGEFSGEQKSFFMAYLAFWGYFEYKSLHAFLYKKIGYELIRIKDGYMYYKRNIIGVEKPKRFDLKNISELGLIQHSRKSFAGAYNKSFWVVGNEQVGFKHLTKKMALGIQISEKEAKEIIRLIRTAIKSN